MNSTPVDPPNVPPPAAEAETAILRGEAHAADSDLAFLQPSTRADSRGRLGHFEILEVLGKGGFGIVFRAFDDVLQRVVAIKVLASALAATSSARKRFLREARAAAQVRHENVVQIYAIEEQPLPYLVMEFIPGETLQQRLDRTDPFEAAEVAAIGRQMAAGLAAAHAAGLIHRDVKPANVLIESGPQLRVKVTDFGLARAADDASLTQTGVVTGTPLYMSPEQARGDALDHRTDLFSLGSVLYALTTGQPPFRASNTLAVLKRVSEDAPRPIAQTAPKAPGWLCRVIGRLMEKDPARRYQNAAEVAEALAPNPSPGPTTQAPRPARRRWRVAVALGVVLALVCLGFGLRPLLSPTDSRPDAGGRQAGPPPGASPPLPIASAADALDRKKIPLQLLARAGGGDPDQAPPELVAVLGNTAPFEPGGDVGGMALRPDGKVLLTGLKEIKLWDVETGNLLVSFDAEEEVGFGGVFSADSSLLATNRRIWDAATRKVVQRFDAGGKKIHGMSFSPKGDRLVVVVDGGRILLWDVTRGAKIDTWDLHPGRHIYGHALSPDGSKLATAPIGGLPCVWDAATGKILTTCRAFSDNSSNYSVSFSKDGKHVVSTRLDDPCAHVWDAETGEGEFRLEGHKAGLFNAAYSPDGALIATAGRMDAGVAVRLWDARTGKPVAALSGPTGPTFGLGFSADGKLLACSGPGDKRAFVWDVATREAVPSQPGHTGPVHAVAFSPDGKALASAGADGTVLLWDLATGKWQRTLIGHQGAVTGLAFRRGSNQLASGGADGTVRLWDVTAEKTQTLRGHLKGEVQVAFSPDGQTLVSAGQDSVKLWDLQSDTPRHTLAVGARAWNPAFSTDGRLMAVGCEDGTVHVWETGTGLELPAPKLAQGSAIRAVAFHPREPLLAVCGQQADGLRFWDLGAGKEMNAGGLLGPARRCLWGPTGKVLIAAGGEKGLVRLWDLRSERPRSKGLALGQSEILGMALSPEGGYLATANGDGTVYVLRLPKQ